MGNSDFAMKQFWPLDLLPVHTDTHTHTHIQEGYVTQSKPQSFFAAKLSQNFVCQHLPTPNLIQMGNNAELAASPLRRSLKVQ